MRGREEEEEVGDWEGSRRKLPQGKERLKYGVDVCRYNENICETTVAQIMIEIAIEN